MSEANNWRVERDEQGIVWCHFDRPDSAVNLLAGDALEQLYEILDGLEKDLPKGIVMLSDKPDSYIFGADIKEFTTLDDLSEAQAFLDRGHRVMNRLAAMKCPTLALVHGICLGGGTELSLACDYIIASDSPKTRIGLPEIKLGIFPGYGGTARTIKRMGVLAAMDIMLTGRTLTSRAARKTGLVDEMVPQRQLRSAAVAFINKKPPVTTRKWYLGMLDQPVLRPLVASMLRKQVAKKASPAHYPAPFELIDLWNRYAGNETRMLKEEASTVARLATTDTARNLVKVFFMQEALKRHGKQVEYKPAHVHVIGGGIMGGDIASWCAIQGYKVTVQDQEPERLAQTWKRAQKSFSKKYKKDKRALRDAGDRLMMDHNGRGVEKADLVIEAIFEDLQVKQDLYRSIEPRMKPDAILATNTSSIMLEDLSTCLERPEKLVGLHFFNPVAMMPLVEVIRYDGTADDVMNKALAFTRDIGKLPLPTKSAPGFLVNRILMPYILEAVIMVSEGKQPELIDKAAKEFGMPMGPIELADTVGLDICKHVAGILSAALGTELPSNLDALVEGGKLGKKSGSGFYEYKDGKIIRNKIESTQGIEDIESRMIMRLLNETMACLREGIVDGEDNVDAGVIFGTGFAPFRGGPINHVRDSGIDMNLSVLQSMQASYGDRFGADGGWEMLRQQD